MDDIVNDEDDEEYDDENIQHRPPPKQQLQRQQQQNDFLLLNKFQNTIKEKILININVKKIDHSHGSPEMLTQGN